MHLGSKIFERISKRPNFKGFLKKVKGEKKYFKDKLTDNDVFLKLWQGIRLACLLHDIGHFPFSHSMERIVSENIQTVYDNDFNQNFERARKEAEDNNKDLKLHEFIGLKMLEEPQKEIYEIIKESSNISSFKIAIDVLNLGNNNLLSTLGVLGKEIDADRMDYVLRDTTMAGATFGSYDVERLIFSLDLHESDGFFEILPNMSGINAVESFFLERLKLYKYLNHHHTVVLYDTLLELIFRLLFMKRTELNDLNNVLREKDRGIDLKWFNYKNFCPDKGPLVDDHLIKCKLHELYIGLLLKIDNKRSKRAKTLKTLEFDKAILEAVLFRGKYHLPLWKDNLVYKQVNNDIERAIKEYIKSNGNRLKMAAAKIEKLEKYVQEKKDTLLLNKIREVFLGDIQDLNNFHRFVKERVFTKDKPYFIGTEAKPFTPLESEDLPAIRSRWAKQTILSREGGKPETLEKTSVLMEGLIDYAGKEIELFAYLILPNYKKHNEKEKKRFLGQGREDFSKLLVEWIFKNTDKIEKLWEL